MNKQDFDRKLLEKFPNENYTVLYYGKDSYDNTVLKCLDCDRRIVVRTGDLFAKRRKHICSKCHYKRADTLRNEQRIIEKLHEAGHTDIEFYMESRGGIRHNMVRHLCGVCGRINTHEVANLLRNKTVCGFCESKQAKDHDYFTQELFEKFGDKFELLTEYKNAKTDVKIRCRRCGFIRNIKPNALLSSGYCPKCDDKASRGERAIQSFLSAKGIPFETQKYFADWNIGIHYFDFYIPSYNLVLEYHGIQHYCYNEFFHKSEEDFLRRRDKDEQKKRKALEKGLNYASISYQNFDQLEDILLYLFNSTTIPQGSRGKLLEIETVQYPG